MNRITYLIALVQCTLFTSGCGAGVTKSTIEFPVSVTIASGNTLEYKTGDIDRSWKEGDTLTFDYVGGVLMVNGLPHFPPPPVMKKEAVLQAYYGNVSWVQQHFDSTKAHPWNAVANLYETFLSTTTRNAEETYARTRSAEAARKILVDSGVFANITITTISGLPALSYEYLGLEDGSPVYLTLRDEAPPPPAGPPSLSLKQASNMARRLIKLVTNTAIHSKVLLQEGNEQVTGVNAGGR